MTKKSNFNRTSPRAIQRRAIREAIAVIDAHVSTVAVSFAGSTSGGKAIMRMLNAKSAKRDRAADAFLDRFGSLWQVRADLASALG